MLGTTVVAGMLAASLLGIFFVPALFVFIERLGGHKDAHAPASTASGAQPSQAASPIVPEAAE